MFLALVAMGFAETDAAKAVQQPKVEVTAAAGAAAVAAAAAVASVAAEVAVVAEVAVAAAAAGAAAAAAAGATSTRRRVPAAAVATSSRRATLTMELSGTHQSGWSVLMCTPTAQLSQRASVAASRRRRSRRSGACKPPGSRRTRWLTMRPSARAPPLSYGQWLCLSYVPHPLPSLFIARGVAASPAAGPSIMRPAPCHICMHASKQRLNDAQMHNLECACSSHLAACCPAAHSWKT